MKTEKSNLQALANGTKTAQEVVRERLVIFIGRGEKGPDKDTVIEKSLVERIIKEIKSGYALPTYPADYDSKRNIITENLGFRQI